MTFLGAENLVQACSDADVSRVVVLSTDKAAALINPCGANEFSLVKLLFASNSINILEIERHYRSVRACWVKIVNMTCRLACHLTLAK